MTSIVDEDPFTRRFRLLMEGLLVALGIAGAAGLVIAGLPLVAVAPGGLSAWVVYLELSTYYRIEALGAGRVLLVRRVGAVEVALKDDARVDESRFGPAMLYLSQGDRRWRIVGTVGGSIAVGAWLEREGRHSDSRFPRRQDP